MQMNLTMELKASEENLKSVISPLSLMKSLHFQTKFAIGLNELQKEIFFDFLEEK